MEILTRAQEALVEGLESQDLRTRVLAAQGVMNYTLATEIAELAQVVLRASVVQHGEDAYAGPGTDRSGYDGPGPLGGTQQGPGMSGY